MDLMMTDENEKSYILVVDDDEIILRLAKQTLMSHYNVVCAKSGKEALEAVEISEPELILTDLYMPEMDGFQMISAIREKTGCAIPFIIMTGNTQNTSEIEGFSFGAEDYLKKPFSYDVMLERVERVLKSEKNQKRLELEAYKDELTGAWNRRFLESKIEEECGQKNNGGAFLLFDLDNFKVINDTYGHKSGDDVLRGFASILRSFTRREDAAARIGGDEFAVFYSGMNGRELAAHRCEEIIEMTRNDLGYMVNRDSKCIISVSIGVSFAPNDGNDFTALYENADKALYDVKKSVKGGYRICADKNTDTGDAAGSDVSGSGANYTRRMISAMSEKYRIYDVKCFSRLMKEDNGMAGAYIVSSDEFLKIYRFLARGMERDNRQAQIALISLKSQTGAEDECASENRRFPNDVRASEALDHAVRGSLRRGDVAARIDRSQYAVILSDTDADNGRIAADRVRRNWKREYGRTEIELEYDVGDIRGAV